MQPKLLAVLAVGAFAGAASAQSSVTLSGIVDAWVGQTNHKVGVNPPGTGFVVDSGGGQASRWNLRGTEDLGGGLKASFMLDQGFAVDSGTVSTVSTSNIGFNRGAYVGLSGDFGELRAGRMLGAFDALRGSTNHLYDSSGFASTGQVWGAGTSAANGLAAVTSVAVAEALAMCVQSGVNPGTFYDVVSQGGGMAFGTYFDRRAKRIFDGDFSPTFMLEHMRKDATLALALAHAVQVPTPMLEETKRTYDEALDSGWGKEDFSAVTHVIEKRINRRLSGK